MKKFLICIALAAVIFVVAGCGEDASKVDIKQPRQQGRSIPSDYSVRVPDRLTVYQNIDEHPTIAVLCIEGLGFFTTSRINGNDSIERLPEKDADCDGVSPEGPELPNEPVGNVDDE